MKRILWSSLAVVLALAPTVARAQTEEEIRNKIMQDLKPWIEQEVQRRVKEAMEAAKTNTTPAQAATQEQLKEVDEKVDKVVEAQKKTLMSEFNPSIGVVGETVFSYRSRGSDAMGSDRPGGFDVFQRSIELNIAASVDPFAKAYVVANASADWANGNEATFGIEEAALQTTSLPWNLELKAGRFFGEFGKLEYIHDHELPMVNRPLAIDEYIGGESRSDGLQVNWLLPVPHYVSLTLGAGDSFGGDSPPNNPGGFRSIDELNFWGRLSTYFDLTPNWQVETGISGLINPRTEDRGGALLQPNGVTTLTERERRLGGVDFQLRYVPLQDNQFRSFTWGTEVLYSDNRYAFDPNGVPNDGDEFTGNVGSLGLYSYATYKFSRQWSAGFLFDYVQNAANEHDVTYAYSPYITWALSHWNQLRLQYTHTDHNDVSGLKDDDAVYLQWAWIIGAHAHGWQQR